MRRALLVAVAATALQTACAGDSDVGSDSANATDSFGKPTVHGELDFEGTNSAAFSDSQRFHGWYFTLSDTASIELLTELQTANLDTKMYLYNADENGKKFGNNLKNNDDYDGTLASRIATELPAGTYFVQVKTTKTAMRGKFELDAKCSGPGCPFTAPPSVQDYCDGADEALGKCVDDSLDATEEGCAPTGYEAILCCNGTPDYAFYCEDLCAAGNTDYAAIFGEDLDRLYEYFPEDDYSGLVDAYSLAVTSCASPDLDQLAKAIVNGTEVAEGFEPEPWLNREDPAFFNTVVDEGLVDAIDGIVGERASLRFESTVEVPCPNCTDGYTIYGFYYPIAGKTIVLEARWGGDS